MRKDWEEIEEEKVEEEIDYNQANYPTTEAGGVNY